VMSEIGQGSTFSVILPARRVRRAAVPEHSTEVSPSATSS